MNGKLKELFSNTFIFTIANFSSKILVFLMVPLYTAVLTTEEYGISDMVNTISGLLIPVLTITISNAVLRFCFIKEYKKEDVYTIGHRIIIIGTIIAAFLTTIAFVFNIIPQLGLYIWFIPAQFLFSSYSSFLSNYSRGIGEVKISAVAGVASTFTIVSLNLIFLLVIKWGILGYMISFVVGSFVSSLVMWIKISSKGLIQAHINRDLRTQMIKYSAPLVPNDLSWWALDSFNRFFILSTLSVSAVGLYSASAKIPAILTVMSGIFTQAWMLSALNGYGTEETTTFIRSVHSKLFSLLAVLTSLFVLFAKPLAIILLTGEFSSCWYMIPYLMIAVFMGALVGFYGSIFSAERKNTMQFVSTLIGALISVILLVLFLNNVGIIIAAIANMIGYIVTWLLRKEGIKKYIDIGKTTFACISQLLLLIGEAVLISLSLWIPALVMFGIIVLLNIKELNSSFIFFRNIVLERIKLRNNG